jgi:uncharacterized protein YecE (DUF72 family)
VLGPRVFQGTQGFANFKLPFITGNFACVEIDSSTYAIPPKESVEKWIRGSPKDFLFHFKAFKAFCYNPTDVKSFPRCIQSLLPPSGSVTINDLSEDTKNALWTCFHDSLLPALTARKLGLVVFQFNLAFLPTSENLDRLRYISKKLHSSFRMGVDFRSRKWIENDAYRSTVTFLSTLREGGVCLIASDDLTHEL